jgi:hypothetical protein
LRIVFGIVYQSDSTRLSKIVRHRKVDDDQFRITLLGYGSGTGPPLHTLDIDTPVPLLT